MNQDDAAVNYSMALKNYNQHGRDRLMRKFCEDEGCLMLPTTSSTPRCIFSVIPSNMECGCQKFL